MLVAKTYLGHREETAVADRLTDADPHRVTLSDTDRRRSRVRTETDDGRDVGLVVGRELRDGDVLETEEGDFVVIDLAGIEALVLDFADADLPTTAALEIGHALGNRHWDLAVRDTEALFPVTDSRERMETAVADLLPDGVTTRFETVSPTLFDEDGPEHDHSHDGHSHGQAGDHTHSHGDGHSHSHDDDHAHSHDGYRSIGGSDG